MLLLYISTWFEGWLALFAQLISKTSVLDDFDTVPHIQLNQLGSIFNPFDLIPLGF